MRYIVYAIVNSLTRIVTCELTPIDYVHGAPYQKNEQDPVNQGEAQAPHILRMLRDSHQEEHAY